MLSLTTAGLYCKAGDFYIDPGKGVDNAVITHAHSDHARRGSKQYYCVNSGEALLRQRIGKNISVTTATFGQSFTLNGVKISFHSAGHILGSSQVRMEFNNQVWVASGDYKREPDPTCDPFEIVPCDVFVTEATFGTPRFKWEKNKDLGKDVFDWWQENRKVGINSVLFAYSLGKAQRLLGVLQQHAKVPIICHPAVMAINECYRQQGIRLAETKCLSEVCESEKLIGELLLVPKSFLKTDRAHILGDNYRTAFASGWMSGSGASHSGFYDAGFVMSDHADWEDLVQTALDSKAKKIYVQHRNGKLIRHLKTLGIAAFPESDLYVSDTEQQFEQMTFF